MVLTGLQFVIFVAVFAARSKADVTATAVTLTTTSNQTAETTEPPTTPATMTMPNDTNTTVSQTTTMVTVVNNTTVQPTNPALLAVEGLAVSNSSTTSVDLTWTKPVGDDHVYNVSYTREDGETGSNTTGEESFHFSGLGPGYNYTFTIAYMVNNKTEGSPKAEKPLVLAPEKPKDITTEPAETALSIKWQKPNGKVESYTVRVNDVLKGSPTSETLNVSNLQPGTLYKIAIKAVSHGKESEVEEVDKATRPKQVIEVFKHVESSVTSFLINMYVEEFIPGALIAVHYQVIGDANYQIRDFPMLVGFKKYNLTNLTPGTEYTAFALTKLNGVESDPIAVLANSEKSISTKFAPPQNLTVISRDTTEVEITWAPFGGHESFELYCNEEKIITKIPSGKCRNLEPGTLFEVYVVTVGKSSETERSSKSTTLTSTTVPAPPKTLTASATDSTTIQVSWEIDKGGLKNWVLNMTFDDGSITSPLILESTTLSYNITGLTPGVSYIISLVARTVDPMTKATYDSQTVSQTERTYPGVPSNLTILETSHDLLRVSWEAPEGEVSFYNVTTCRSNNNSICQPAINGPETFANLTALTPSGVQWTVKVTSVSGGKESLTSLELDAYTYPLKLLGLTIDNVSTANATVSWQRDPGDQAEKLFLRWEPSTGTGAMTLSGTYTLDVNITGLTPGQRYDFFIKAQSGPWNSIEISNATTMVPDSPSNLVPILTSPKELTIVWNLTDGVYDSFIAVISPAPTTGPATIDTNITQAAFANLVPGTEYKVSVTTKSLDRESTTVIQAFNTSEIAPGPPRNLTVAHIVSRVVRLKWEEPIEKNGWILHYILSYTTPTGVVVSRNTSQKETSEGMKQIEGLTPITEYTFWVVAVNGAGEGELSENVTATTEESESGPVSNFTVTKDTAFSMAVSWGYPPVSHGTIRHYILDVKLSSTGGCQQVILFNCSDCPATNETMDGVETECYPKKGFTVDGIAYEEKAMVSYNATSLRPYTNYTFVIYPMSKPGVGNKTTLTEVTEEYYPGKLNNINFTDITSTSFKVVWSVPLTPNGIITKYDVIVTDRSTGGNKTFSTANPPTEQLVANLKMFTTYSVNVRAYTRVGPGSWSDLKEVTTAEDAPTAVLNLTVESSSSTTLELSWDQPSQLNGILREYIIFHTYRQDNVDITKNTTVSHANETTNYTLEGLEKWTLYNVSVGAITVARGPLESRVVKTQEDVPEGPPIKVVADNETSTALRVSWEPPVRPNGIITNYAVRYTDVETVATLSEDTNDNTTSIVIDGLRSYKDYSISVCANTSKGQGLCSPATTWRTDEDIPSPPKNVVVSEANSTFFLIRWDVPDTPNGVILGYDILATTLNDASETTNTTNEMEIYITGLTPNNNYSIQVRAKTVKGNGNWSDVIYEITSEDRPSKVQNCHAEALSSTVIALTWLQPENPNGEIKKYIIRYNNETRTVDDGSTIATNLTDLEKWTDYKIYIRAATILEGSEVKCDPFPIKTLEDVPDAPTNLQTPDVKPYELTLKWGVPTNPNGVITNYTIAYGIIGDDGNVSVEATITVDGNTTVKVESLVPCRYYSFKVQAHTKVGPGEFSDALKVTTADNKPGKPFDLILKAVSSEQLKLTWTKPNETCRATYTIRVWKHELSGEKQIETRPPFEVDDPDGSLPRTTTLDIYELNKYTLYSVDVKVEIGGHFNISDRTEQVRTFEDRAGPVDSFIVVVCDKCYTSVFASWSAPKEKNGEIKSYRITWTIEGQTKKYNKTFPPKTFTFNITENIWSEKKYTFKIQAENGFGLGEEKIASHEVETKSGPAIPVFTDSNEMTRMIVKGTEEVKVDKWRQIAINLATQLFDMRNGEVTLIGVFVATEKHKDSLPTSASSTSITFAGWRKTLDSAGKPTGEAYLIKPMEKPPSSWKKVSPTTRKRRAADNNVAVIGEKTDCSPSGEEDYCNGPLLPETKYHVVVGAYTKYGFTPTPSAEFTTEAVPFPLIAVIAGCVCAALIIIIIIIVVICMKRKRRKRAGDLGLDESIELGTKTTLMGTDNDAFVITDDFGDEVTVSKPGPINIRSFPAQVGQMHHDDDKLFKWQYKLLEKVSPVNQMRRATENEAIKSKNRYVNILPFDHSLVHLKIPEGEESTPAAGYTNASYIPGNNHRREYIACQGPLGRTIDDFWQMVWEQNITTVIMLTKVEETGKEKCAKYWPPDQTPVIRGDLEVQLLSESFMDDYVIRMIELSDLQTEKKRKVMQFHFLSWPDWGKPDSAYYLLNFLDVVKNHQRSTDTGPKLVHCSAGIGRTGTYITVERLLDQITRQPAISVFDTILDLRESRKGMVQGAKQYTYIHECLKDGIEHKLARKQSSKPSPKLGTAVQNGNKPC